MHSKRQTQFSVSHYTASKFGLHFAGIQMFLAVVNFSSLSSESCWNIWRGKSHTSVPYVLVVTPNTYLQLEAVASRVWQRDCSCSQIFLIYALWLAPQKGAGCCYKVFKKEKKRTFLLLKITVFGLCVCENIGFPPMLWRCPDNHNSSVMKPQHLDHWQSQHGVVKSSRL